MYVCALAANRPPGTPTLGPLAPSDSASGPALGVFQAAVCLVLSRYQDRGRGGEYPVLIAGFPGLWPGGR